MPKVFKLQEDSIAAITTAMSVVQPSKDFTERGKQKINAPSNFVLEDRSKTYQASFLRARRPLSKKMAEKLCSFFDAIYEAGELDMEEEFPESDLPLLSELLQAYLVARKNVPDFVRNRCDDISKTTSTPKSNGGLKREFFCVVGPVDTDPLENDNGGEAIYQTAFPMCHAKQLKELDELSQQVYKVGLSTLTAPYLFLVNNVDKDPEDIRALLGLTDNGVIEKRGPPATSAPEKVGKVRKSTAEKQPLAQNLVRALQAKKSSSVIKESNHKGSPEGSPHGVTKGNKGDQYPVTPEGEMPPEKKKAVQPSQGFENPGFGQVHYAQPMTTITVPIQYAQPPSHPQYLPVQHSYAQIHPYAQAQQPHYAMAPNQYQQVQYSQVQQQAQQHPTTQYVNTYPANLAPPNLNHTHGSNNMNGNGHYGL